MAIIAGHDIWSEFLGYCGKRVPTPELAGTFVKNIEVGAPRDPATKAALNTMRMVLTSRLKTEAYFANQE